MLLFKPNPCIQAAGHIVSGLTSEHSGHWGLHDPTFETSMGDILGLHLKAKTNKTSVMTVQKYNNGAWGLERCLCGWECSLLYQRTWVWVPAPTLGSKPAALGFWLPLWPAQAHTHMHNPNTCPPPIKTKILHDLIRILAVTAHVKGQDEMNQNHITLKQKQSLPLLGV